MREKIVEVIERVSNELISDHAVISCDFNDVSDKLFWMTWEIIMDSIFKSGIRNNSILEGVINIKQEEEKQVTKKPHPNPFTRKFKRGFR